MTNEISKKRVDKMLSTINGVKDIVLHGLDVRQHYGNSDLFLIEINGVIMILKVSVTSYETGASKNPGFSADQEAEIKILKLFKKEFIDKNITPAIVEILFDKTAPSSTYKVAPKKCDFFKTNFSNDKDSFIDEMFCRHNELAKLDITDGRTTFLILEACSINLRDFLHNYNFIQLPILKSLLFVLLHALWAISCKFPSFHHADLHTSNIMLNTDVYYTNNCFEQIFLGYQVGKVKYKIPYYGIIPKIIDFGFSSIESEGIVNIHMKEKGFKHYRVKNDFLWLMHDIYLGAANVSASQSIIWLLEQIDPSHRFMRLNPDYINAHSEKTINEDYEMMLKCEVFAEYRGKNNKSFTSLKTSHDFN